MKKLISMAAVILIAVSAFAQTTNDKEKKVAKAEAKYCCPKCDHCSTTAGSCEHHKMAMVKDGKYYCPMHSDIASDKEGKCTKCGMTMEKMETETKTKYCCPKDDWNIPPVKGQCPHSTEAVLKEGTLYCVYTHDNPGKCAKCGMDMEKIEVKEKKKAKKEKEEHDHKH